MPQLTFYGAAREVTGSCYLLETAGFRLLMDCGMHQGGSDVDRIRKDKFRFRPSTIDAVILSHGHLDHSGLLPKLVNRGFSGPIYCSAATADLLEILLRDSWGLYNRDLERENVRRARHGRKPLEPEYDEADVQTVLSLCERAEYGDCVQMSDAVTACFHDAGHILGSSIVELTIQESGKQKRLVFSGDLGNSDSPLMKDPE
ncbi:MAG: MBL fold metallo-hydrolase, partial [Pseudomonadales bacterium]|nr:MBL fold metallo-hydrolase [Pseudomonadales bacterium]